MHRNCKEWKSTITTSIEAMQLKINVIFFTSQNLVYQMHYAFENLIRIELWHDHNGLRFFWSVMRLKGTSYVLPPATKVEKAGATIFLNCLKCLRSVYSISYDWRSILFAPPNRWRSEVSVSLRHVSTSTLRHSLPPTPNAMNLFKSICSIFLRKYAVIIELLPSDAISLCAFLSTKLGIKKLIWLQCFFAPKLELRSIADCTG